MGISSSLWLMRSPALAVGVACAFAFVACGGRVGAPGGSGAGGLGGAAGTAGSAGMDAGAGADAGWTTCSAPDWQGCGTPDCPIGPGCFACTTQEGSGLLGICGESLLPGESSYMPSDGRIILIGSGCNHDVAAVPRSRSVQRRHHSCESRARRSRGVRRPWRMDGRSAAAAQDVPRHSGRADLWWVLRRLPRGGNTAPAARHCIRMASAFRRPRASARAWQA